MSQFGRIHQKLVRLGYVVAKMKFHVENSNFDEKTFDKPMMMMKFCQILMKLYFKVKIAKNCYNKLIIHTRNHNLN